MNFEFQTAGRIVFGVGSAQRLGTLAKSHGSRALLVTGKSALRSQLAEEQLERAEISYAVIRTDGEPSIQQARDASARGRDFGAQFVVAWGGGSALDLGKAAAALIASPGDPLEYLEVVGAGKELPCAALPTLAIPTTAGTGAEVTKNAVLSDEVRRVKVSLRHESMLPRLALVDPELTLNSPAPLTAAAGLDAMTQCLEPLLSCQHNPMTDGFAAEGLRRGALALERAFESGDDLEARTEMALCSLFGGLALANAKLGAVHGLAGPLGGLLKSPHGALCAHLLPTVFEVNVRALRARAPQSPLLPRFDWVARIVTGHSNAVAEDAVTWLGALVAKMGIPGLGSSGLTPPQLNQVATAAREASSMKGNPIRLESDELVEILERCL